METPPRQTSSVFSGTQSDLSRYSAGGDTDTEEEKQDVIAFQTASPSVPSPKRVLRRSSRKRGTQRVQRLLHVGDKSVEVDLNYNAYEFDKFLGMKPQKMRSKISLPQLEQS